MAMNKPLDIPSATIAQQQAASDPGVSSWVSANAGSGKTHVLTQRVIRLLLAGNMPDRILCLTFTKAAAANMKNRVFETLGSWTMMPDDVLDVEIEKMTGMTDGFKTRTRARQLFARALDTPGGLKIQTIHAFCESLLHQFPLEANVPGHFTALQDAEKTWLIQQAKADVLAGRTDDEIIGHYEALIPNASDHAIEAGLNAIINMRQGFLEWSLFGVEEGIASLSRILKVSPDLGEEQLFVQALSTLPLSEEQINAIIPIAREGTESTDIPLATGLLAFLREQQPQVRFNILCSILLTQKNTPKKRLVTKTVEAILPGTIDSLLACACHLVAALERNKARQLVENSFHLFKIAEAVIERYETLKRRRGMIDFDDQIEKCATLLNRSDISDWIRYRLDRGIDHVLVDEAQDTSPAQWQVINAVVSDFHTGQGASKTNRTVFVVGDDKQSIYSFQGAEPREFHHQEMALKKRVFGAQKAFHPGVLNLSFRSAPDVLRAVDEVFSIPENAHGLTQSGENPPHDAIRRNDPGEVQIWPLFQKPETVEPENWIDPIDKSDSGDPAVRLAERISDTISQWVGKPLLGQGAPVKYGDILVLVRKRDRFLNAFTRTMKDKGLAIAGADRFKLTDHIAIEDLLAIGRLVLMPQDDLTFATVLKGMFFNVSEAELFDLVKNRENTSLHEHLTGLAGQDENELNRLAGSVTARLETFITLRRQSNVFEFYSRLLSEHDGRRNILGRLGSEAEDALDVFLEEALTFSLEGKGGLETFISQLTASQPEIKRETDLEKDEVRVLTTHSAKGLEARVVFLVDACGKAWSGTFRPPVLEISDGGETGQKSLVWLPDQSLNVEATLESTQQIQADAEAEYRRLLYVGMTRAADCLIMCGYCGKKQPEHPYWHKIVKEALVPTAAETHDSNGEINGWRWPAQNTHLDIPHTAEEVEKQHPQKSELPSWLFEKTPSEPPLPRPLTPSGAFALIEDDEGIVSDSSFGYGENNETFFLEKGNVTHRLLEILPELDENEKKRVAENHINHCGANWKEAQRQSVFEDVFAILENELFAGIYGENSKAEIAVTGKLDTSRGNLLISGQIDRLVIGEGTVTIIDYKTNMKVPRNETEVSDNYLGQMALYREMVQQIFPDKTVHCSFLWTQTPELMPISNSFLDESLKMIKTR